MADFPGHKIEAHIEATVDELCPPKVQKLMQHLHNAIVIMDMYRFLGMETPDWLKVEMGRAELAIQIQIEIEHRQGGAYHKMKEKEKAYETRSSEQQQDGFDEGGTKVPRRPARLRR